MTSILRVVLNLTIDCAGARTAMKMPTMGFASGRSNCQGQALAQAEMSAVLAELCSKDDFEVVDEGHNE